MSIFGNMFTQRDPWITERGYVDTFPWEKANINATPVTDYSKLGYGRAVGQRIIG